MPPVSSSFQRQDFLRFLLGGAFAAMLLLVMLQEIFGAATTWLVIRVARDITEDQVSAGAFLWIVVTQTLSYLAGAASWIYAERSGFNAFGKYLLHFARRNRFQTALLADSEAREAAEPFLTNETFRVCFDLMYDLQFYLRLFFNIVFNAAVLGLAIDSDLPIAYALAFALLVLLQWLLRKPLAAAYLHNQRMTNRMMARTYNAWDNIFSGNRYNFGLWHRDFRDRLQGALSAQIKAILAREGWSALSGIIALVIVLAATAWVAAQDAGNTALLIALAATLPRQIEMTLDMHQLTAGMTDLLAIRRRIKGICEHMQPVPKDMVHVSKSAVCNFASATGKELAPAWPTPTHLVLAEPQGLVSVRGGNGAGKSPRSSPSRLPCAARPTTGQPTTGYPLPSTPACPCPRSISTRMTRPRSRKKSAPRNWIGRRPVIRPESVNEGLARSGSGHGSADRPARRMGCQSGRREP